MAQCKQPAFCILFALLGTPLYSQSSAAWKDPSPHIPSFVTVENGVRLEVLDWGGTGRPIVLLAGGGNTAHIFDDFAPKLTDRWHVYGITRRGFGASGYSATNDPADRLGDDVMAVIEALKLDKPILVGHSLAGAELSSVARRHPDRVAGLVYLDAAYSYAFDNGKGSSIMEIQKLQGPQPPPPSGPDLASFHALQNYYERVNGLRGDVEVRMITCGPDAKGVSVCDRGAMVMHADSVDFNEKTGEIQASGNVHVAPYPNGPSKNSK